MRKSIKDLWEINPFSQTCGSVFWYLNVLSGKKTLTNLLAIIEPFALKSGIIGKNIQKLLA